MKSYWNDVGSTIVEITEVLQTRKIPRHFLFHLR